MGFTIGETQRAHGGPTFTPDDLSKVDYVVVLERREDLNLPNRCDWEALGETHGHACEIQCQARFQFAQLS